MFDAAYLGAEQQSKVYLGSDLIIGSEPIDPLDIAPAEDQPVITTQPVSQWDGPTIPGSAGWWRERRTDYAETVVGEPQSATTGLDMGGSSYFRYPCMPGAVAHPANPSGFVYTEFKPGGDSQNARWLFNLRFVTSSPTMELRFRSSVTNPDLGLVLVNGRRIQERTVTQTLGEAGVGYSTTLTFPDSRQREITIFGMNSVAGNFGGVAVEAGYTVAMPLSASSKKIAVIGDSYVNGHNTVSASETFAWRLAFAMGADCVLQAGIGGTGWAKQIGGDPDSVFSGRIGDVLSLMPDVVIVAGGRNDTTGGLAAAVGGMLDGLSGAGEVVVMPTASESTQAGVRSIMQSVCADRGVRYLDVAIDSLDKIADGIHPTWGAHQQLADQAYDLYSTPPEPFDPSVLPVYDEFSDVADGDNPTTAESGQAWGIFSGPSSVTGGYWDSDDNTAAYLECDSGLQPVTHIGARFRFNDMGGTKTTSGTLALVTWADGGIVNEGFGRRTSCHVTITQHFVQWYVRDTENGGNVTLLSTQTLSQLPANVDLTVDVRIGNGVGTVEVGGQTLTWTDERISPVDGERFVCWEPFYGGGETDTRAQVAEVWADGTPPEPVEVGLTGAAYTKSETSMFTDSVTVPATVQEGDLLLLVAQFISGAATPLEAPTGWSEIGQHTRSAISAACWWKIADAGDIGQPVAVTSPVDRVHNLAVYGIAGVQSVTLGGSNDQGSGSTDFTVPSYTPTAGAIPAHVLCVVSSTNPDPVAFTAPSGMEVVSDNMPMSGDRQGILLGVADGWEPDATPGTTWVADDTTHFGIKWAIEFIPS